MGLSNVIVEVEGVDWLWSILRGVLRTGLLRQEEPAGGGELRRGVRGLDFAFELAVGFAARCALGISSLSSCCGGLGGWATPAADSAL